MITRLEGQLDSVADGGCTLVLPGGIAMRLLLPGFTAARLGGSLGRRVTLHTYFFLEAPSQGTTILPRLAGFLTEEDRAFFELFITVKGVGARKALRAMALPSAQLAAAIVDRDAATLQSLPEIGKRTAETIVVALKDKAEPFLAAPSAARAATSKATANGVEADAPPEPGPSGTLAREALQVLLQLGENRVDALRLIDRVLADDDPPTTPSDLVAAVYRLSRA